MALVDNAWYVNYGNGTSTGYYAIAQWTALTVYAAGALIRQLAAPAVGSERVFVCVVAGTSLAAEPTWTITRGAKTAEAAGPTWQECTGIAALNGDATNTPSWTITATPPGGVKNTAVTLGQVIKRDSGASYQICTTAGTAGNGAEPSFSNTAGTTTSDNTVTWTSLGVVGNFTGWQAPHARLQGAVASTWGQAGNTFFISSAHAETQASAMTLTSISNVAAPIYVVSVNAASAVPPTVITAGASITTTGNSALDLGASSYVIYNGTTISCGNGANAPSLSLPRYGRFIGCAFVLGGTSSQVIISQSNPGITILENTTLQVAAVGSGIRANGLFIWKDTPSAIQGATLPTNVFITSNVANGSLGLVTGVDFGALGSNTLVNGSAQYYRMVFSDCKLGASATVAGVPTTPYNIVDFIRCDSAGTNYIDGRVGYMATQTQETTVVRTGGSSDGTTPVSWKIASTSNAKWGIPFESQPITIWNNSTSAITTLTFYGTTTGGGVPNNDDIWVDVEYLGSASTPQSSSITTTKTSVLDASVTTNNSSDASTWGGGGAGNGFKIVVPSFTPGMAGPINITIKVAKASSTYYIDPRPSISGVTVSKSFILSPGVYVNELSSGTGGGFVIGG